MIYAFNKVYGEEALYFYENKKSNYNALMEKFKSGKGLGVRIDTLFKNRPAFYAGRNLPNTIEELQPIYTALTKTYSEKNSTKKRESKFAFVQNHQFFVLNGQRGSGSFNYNGKEINYKFKNDLEREYFDQNQNKFTTEELQRNEICCRSHLGCRA